MKISRRKFFGLLGASAALTAKSAFAAGNKEFKGNPNAFGVLHDSSLCIGCRECEKACNDVNDLGNNQNSFEDKTVLNKKRRTNINAFTVVNKNKTTKGDVFTKTQCNHCIDPACASACLVKALKKTKDGHVTYDASLCLGCRYCMVACPFNIPAYEYHNPLEPKVRKCTMCYSRFKKGEIPGCVSKCPKEALVFGKRADLLKIAQNKIAKNPNRYVNHIYGEKEMGGTSWLYLSPVKFKEIGFREDLGTTSAGKLTAPCLASVPVIVGLWPIFLTGLYAITKRKEAIAKEEQDLAIKTTFNNANKNFDEKLKLEKEKFEKTIKTEVKKALEKQEVESKKSNDKTEKKVTK